MNLWNKNFTPMLLSEKNKPFNSTDYIYELKYDGIRALIYATPKKVIIKTRNNIDITHKFIELESIKTLVKENTIFDGEIVIYEKNKPDFSKVQERLRLKNKDKIKLSSINNPTVFVCFDILYLNKDLTNTPLIKRKEILNAFKDTEYFIKSKYFPSGIELFKKVKSLSLEGIVAKKKNSTYEINKRTDNWIKIKNLKEETFIIGGYSITNNYTFTIYLGEYINNKLHFIGKLNISKKNKLYITLTKMKKTKSKFINNEESNVIYISPTIKCKVKYLERTKNNHLREATFIKVIEK